MRLSLCGTTAKTFAGRHFPTFLGLFEKLNKKKEPALVRTPLKTVTLPLNDPIIFTLPAPEEIMITLNLTNIVRAGRDTFWLSYLISSELGVGRVTLDRDTKVLDVRTNKNIYRLTMRIVSVDMKKQTVSIEMPEAGFSLFR